jgi:hypothetical protein
VQGASQRHEERRYRQVTTKAYPGRVLSYTNKYWTITITVNKYWTITITFNKLWTVTITFNKLWTITIDKCWTITITFNKFWTITITSNRYKWSSESNNEWNRPSSACHVVASRRYDVRDGSNRRLLVRKRVASLWNCAAHHLHWRLW